MSSEPPDDNDNDGTIPASVFASLMAEAQAALEEGRRFRSVSLRQLRERPPPTYRIDGILQADSLALLEGMDGTYKSFLALAWSHCIALGIPWHGREVEQGRVLYVLGESTSGLNRRADAWQIMYLGERVDEDLEDNLRFLVDETPQLWQGDATPLVADNPGPFALVVIDTLARSFVGGNENQQQDMGMFVAGCEHLRKAYPGATVLVVHHLNAAGASRGSTSLKAAVDTQLRMLRQTGTKLVSLKVVKQRHDIEADVIEMRANVVELGTVDVRGKTETSLVLQVLGSNRVQGSSGPKLSAFEIQALYALVDLNKRSGPATFAQWRDAARLSKSGFLRARKSLTQDGYWVRQTIRDSAGVYIADLGRVQGPEGPKRVQDAFLDPDPDEWVQGGPHP